MSGPLGDRLRAVEVPDEEAARERALRVALAAFEERDVAEKRRLPLPRLAPAIAAGLAVLVALLAFTPPGQAVSDWVREAIGIESPARAPRPALERLPAAGSLLVRSPEGPWVVRADGSKRLLGPYGDATWSPQARFVAVTRASGLLAVEPGGRVRWSLARPGARRPRWAPSGFRVAYLVGGEVRVVAGDGTGDRRLGRGVAAEWRPGGAGRNVLAVARADGSVRVLDVDARRTLWRADTTATGPLAWSADGRRLIVGRDVLRAPGRLLRRIPSATEAAFAPRGRRIALVRRHRGTSQLLLIGGSRTRLLFAGAGRLRGLTWSPDGRWLLGAWPTADEFLFVRTTGPPMVEAVSHVARDFDPRSRSARGAPTPAGWR